MHACADARHARMPNPCVHASTPVAPCQACRTALKKEAKGSKFDCVVHDGAPNVGGAWSNEAYTQTEGRPREGREDLSLGAPTVGDTWRMEAYTQV
eukprot:365015-Chlamydomonas_euryale.AAC.2